MIQLTQAQHEELTTAAAQLQALRAEIGEDIAHAEPVQALQRMAGALLQRAARLGIHVTIESMEAERDQGQAEISDVVSIWPVRRGA